MMRHTRIKRVSDKRKAATGRQWSTLTAPRKPIKPKRRSVSEYARIYGSKARVEWVKSLPCAACGIVGYSHNAHVLGNGGMARKADHTTIAPLCGPHYDVLGFAFGCHNRFDQYPEMFAVEYPDFNAEAAARDIAARWLTITQEAKQA